jgi:hypothetical protein
MRTGDCPKLFENVSGDSVLRALSEVGRYEYVPDLLNGLSTYEQTSLLRG